jgi:tetratricopeptide (TPR) repeat protein
MELLNRFNVDLAGSFIDIGQNVIANYISGDEAELERRRYYNSSNNNYDVYVRMFELAYKLSQADKYYSTKAEIFLYYFSGLALRLKIPLTQNQAVLIEQALALQKKALALEEYAAYIYNELGVLYQFKNDLAEAEKYFNKATQLSPAWAIPQSNLSGLFILKKDYQKAMAFVDRADSLQKKLQSVSINRGFIHEQKGNLLFAEEDYRYAIDINSRHFAPFERLGYVYMNTTDYALADSFFYEADLRKKGYHFTGNDWGRAPANIVALPFAPFNCPVDPSVLKPTDIFAFFTWGVQEYEKKNYADAVKILRLVIVNDKTNPLVFHYLGKIYYDQQKWEEAEVMFKFALQYSKNPPEFKQYVDSVKASVVYPYDHECFEIFFAGKYYKQIEDYYFTGTLYENWRHIEEAETFFKKIIQQDSPAVGGYLKLWRLYEAQERYTEAEGVMKHYAAVDKEQSERELNELYRRIIEKFPDNGDWNYRLGLLLYNLAPFNAKVTYFDTIIYFPLLNKELFIDRALYNSLEVDKNYAMFDLNASGSKPQIYLNDDVNFEGRKTYKVPGTHETIFLEAPVYFPRKDGIQYLQRAAELLSEKETLADIHFKTGNMYLWAGSKKQAYPYFEKSLSLVPVNANARLTLVDLYKALYKNRKAFNQLNYLNDSSQINFEKRLLLARYNIYAGQFDKATALLNKIDSVHPFILPEKTKQSYRSYILKDAPQAVLETTNLKGLSNMLAGKPKEAISFYNKSVAEQQLNPGYNNYALYSLARLHAATGNTNEAWKYLQDAINTGFNFSYVLQNDSYMYGLRKTAKWQTMMNGIAIKKYKKDKPLN